MRALGYVTNESITSFGLENSIYCSLDITCVLSSAGMTFRAEQSLDGAPPGLESMFGHIANFSALRAPTQTAPTKSMLPLDDVPSTGLWRLRHMLATFAWILEEHRTGGAARAMALTISWRRSGDNGKDGGCGMRGIESERERFTCPAFHFHPRSQHAMWSSPRSRARFNRACVRCPWVLLSEMLFLQHGCVNLEDRPLSSMAWTRAERAADSVSAAVCVSSSKQWLLIRSFMVSCVSPIAGRSSCDSVSGSESTTWCQDVISVNDCCRPQKYAAKGCGGTSR